MNTVLKIIIITIAGVISMNSCYADSEQNNISQPKALAMRYVPALNKSVSFISLGALEMGRDWGVGNQGERHHQTIL